jgi:hypothetical protein
MYFYQSPDKAQRIPAVEFAWNQKGELVRVGCWPVYHDGPVAMCKGDDTAKQAEQQQAAFNQQLMAMMQQQFGKQTAIFDYLKGKMQPMIDNPTGYSDQALAAMRAGATDTISGQYQQAQKALQTSEFSGGGRDLPSGVNEQLNATLLNQEAVDKGNSQNGITLANENLKQQNYWNAVNALNGVGTQYNPLGYANAATAGSGAVANLSNAVTASEGPGWGSILGGLAGGAITGITSAAGQAGGFSKLFCWIAAAHFGGPLDPRTMAVRDYLLNDFGQRWYGKPVVATYKRHGQWIAKQKILVTALGPLIDRALVNARAN